MTLLRSLSFSGFIKDNPGMAKLAVTVIGAGIAGLSCARRLSRQGFRVTVLEKSRGPGGRVSTRRHQDLHFDHGAQYFTVRSDSLNRLASGWLGSGKIQRWDPRFPPESQPQTNQKECALYVGVPKMSVLGRNLAEGLDVSYGTYVSAASLSYSGKWRIQIEGSDSKLRSDLLIVAVPAPQALRIVPELRQFSAIPKIQMAPCWAAMFSPAAPIGADFEAAAPSDSILSWVAKNSSKPGRGPAECWVIHASPEFSAERLEDSPEQVAHQLVQEFARLFGIRSLKSSFLTAHRWRYARPMATVGQPFLYDNELRLGACGDWCIEARVEGAFLSGEALAGAISAQCQPARLEF